MTIKKSNQKALKRWQHNRFGMFIHWGLYALPARHEWVKSQEQIAEEDYQKYFDHFCPDKYEPKEWACRAKQAGMKYVVLTTKHHEGFCLWDTKRTDYKVTNTPYGKDLIKMYVDAFRSEGIRIGFYHSLLDWHHPEYTVDRHHPMRDNEEWKKKNKNRDMKKYAKYLHAQARELLTEFGEIDIIFYDFSFEDKGRKDWESEKLAEMTRELQPNILINDRLDLENTEYGWDFVTPEQFMARECPARNGKPVPWETCQTFSGSWGYHREESTWKSVEQLIKLLIDTVSKAGNLLLNVGPTGRGEFDYRAKERLAGMGEWMDSHGGSIYGCTQAPAGFKAPQDCRLTYNPEAKKVYIHIFSWFPTGELYLEGFAGKIKYAQLLNDASEIKFGARAPWQARWEKISKNVISLKLPIKKPNVAVPVIELFLK